MNAHWSVQTNYGSSLARVARPFPLAYKPQHIEWERGNGSSWPDYELALLKEEGEKSIFDSVWFSMYTAVLEGAAMCTASISLVGYDSEVRSLETVHRLRYFRFCNVLHIWTIRAIPTYRVYRLYDYGSLLHCSMHGV